MGEITDSFDKIFLPIIKIWHVSSLQKRRVCRLSLMFSKLERLNGCKIIRAFTRFFFFLVRGHFFLTKNNTQNLFSKTLRFAPTSEVTVCLCCLGAGCKNLNRRKGKSSVKVYRKTKINPQAITKKSELTLFILNNLPFCCSELREFFCFLCI